MLALPACGGIPPPPQPTPPPPQPTPTPAPPASPQAKDGKWDPALRGATNCCDDDRTPDVDEGLADGWTLVNEAALDRINGPDTVNLTHVRLGPFSAALEGSLGLLSGPDRAKGKAILHAVRRYGPGPEILDDARASGAAAWARGIYTEWDVVDNWALVNRGFNFFGDGCSVTQGPPPQRYLDWVAAVVEATWDLPGIYNLGNEGFRCDPSPEWERGLYAALKSELAAHGVSRPVCNTITVANTRVTFDYRSYHGWFVPSASWSRDVPSMLTETDNDMHDAAAWAQLARQSEERGFYVSIWRGPESWDSHNGAIAAMPKLGEGWPPRPTPPPVAFPVRFPKPDSVIYMRAARWNRGCDATPRMRGDRELCEALHHVPVPGADCHFDSDVWTSSTQRGDYEALVLAGARDGEPLPDVGLCPVWEFTSAGVSGRCHDDRESVPLSCDHFGSVGAEDDPQTPDVFEGKPEVCGLQRDEFGPYAGFFMVPQCPGSGRECSVRACGPMGQACSDWIRVTWRD